MNSKKKKERIRKAVISYVAVIALLTCLPFSGVSVYGETVPDYNVGKAVEYAENHYSDQSTTTTDKPDCTQFVRECFEAGGVPKDENRTNENGPYGYTVDAYVDYLVNNGYATIEPLKTENRSGRHRNGMCAQVIIRVFFQQVTAYCIIVIRVNRIFICQ